MTSASEDDGESRCTTDSNSYSHSESNDSSDEPESDSTSASKRKNRQSTASAEPVRGSRDMGRGCGPRRNREDMTGNIMVVCVQCAMNSRYWDVPTDVRTMGAGLIIGNFHDIVKCDLVACQLRRQQKVTNGEGRVYLEEPFWVLNKSSHTILAGQRWPVLIAARKTATKQIVPDYFARTPDGGAVYVFQCDFKKLVCGQSHMRFAILQQPFWESTWYKTFEWSQVADMLDHKTVRFVTGHLKPKGDPLIAALKGRCATRTVVFEHHNLHPVCFLGAVGKTTGTIFDVKYEHCDGKINTMAAIPEVKGKTPQVLIRGVSKFFFGLHGSRCIRSDAKIKERQATRNERRPTKQNVVDEDDI